MPIRFNEIGSIDAPAQLRYILELTKQETLSYIGHSQGTMSFWVAMETNPDLNDKIDLMFALGPAARLAHMRSPVKYLAPYFKEIEVTINYDLT